MIDPREFKDMTIECSVCHVPFTFNAGEQSFYQDKGLDQPKKCKVCKASANEKREVWNQERQHPSGHTTIGETLRYRKDPRFQRDK
jgi:hypothetical protein